MRTLICIPCMDTVSTVFFRAMMNLQCVGDVEYQITQSTLIYNARNQLCHDAIVRGFDRMLWFDSDMEFPPDTMLRLMDDMDAGRELVSGLYFGRHEPIRPTIFTEIEYQKVEGSNQVIPYAKTYDEYPEDKVFEIAGCGFGCVMVTVDLCRRIADKFGLPFSPLIGFGEDISFCKRATDLGVKLYCDSAIKCGHQKHIMVTEDTWKNTRAANRRDPDGTTV